jgi:multidrug efflux pump subunit AcrB
MSIRNIHSTHNATRRRGLRIMVVMKTFIIIVLFFALLAAAFFTRPDQHDFKSFIVKQQTKNDTNDIKKAIDQTIAEKYADHVQFKDRYLWVDVQREGKTIYTGAFAHWFNRADVQNELQKIEDKSKENLDKLDQKAHSI